MYTKPKMPARKKEHYLDNKKFLAELEKYRAKIARNEREGKPKPRVNYMYKDDMICDGVENCIQYIDNFDPAKSKNPFAYFTQIVYFAFLRRIAKEKRQMEIRDKIIEKSGYQEVFSVDGNGGAEMNQIKQRIETTQRNK